MISSPESATRRPSCVVPRVLSTLLGIAFFAFLVLMRLSPGTITAGHWRIFFQFGRPAPDGGVAVPLLALVALTTLAFLSLLLVRSVRTAVRNLVSDRRRMVGLAAVLFIWILTMVPLDSAREPRYSTNQATYVELLFGSLGVLFLLYGLGRALDFAGRWADRGYASLLRIPARVLIAGCAAIVLVATNLISWLVFNHIPHVQDSVVQVFQARLFAMGKLFAQSPAYPQFFDMPGIINNGRWYGMYPFGHPLFLALGVLVGAPWLINPLLGTLTAVVIYYLGREIYDEATARIGVVLATLSPFLLLMSSEFMSHASALLLAALFLLCYARAMDVRVSTATPPKLFSSSAPKPSPLVPSRLLPALLAGLCLGMVIDIRPYTGLLLALPFVVDAIIHLARDWRGHWRRVAVMLGAGALMAGLLLLYNYLTNGSAFRLGYTVRWGPGHDLGFSQSGWREGYTLTRRIVENGIELYSLNRYLFEFPIPSLLFIVILFAGTTRDRWDWLLIGTVLSLTVGYFFYWWHFVTFGPRWQYEALPALVLLTARGMLGLPGFLENACRVQAPRENLRRWLGKLLVVCYAGTLAIGLPSRLAAYVHSGLGTQAVTMETVRRANIHNAIVFNRKYEETFLQSPIPPGGDVIYARDLSGADPLLTRQFPGRSSYIVKRETLFRMNNVEFERAPVKAGLDSIVALLQRTSLAGYKTLLWPADELRDMIEPLTQRQGITVRTYRELLDTLKGDANGVAGYLPAIAAWIISDRSDGMALFTYMDRGTDQTLGPYQFRHLATAPNGSVTLFDIRNTQTGRPLPLMPGGEME